RGRLFGKQAVYAQKPQKSLQFLGGFLAARAARQRAAQHRRTAAQRQCGRTRQQIKPPPAGGVRAKQRAARAHGGGKVRFARNAAQELGPVGGRGDGLDHGWSGQRVDDALVVAAADLKIGVQVKGGRRRGEADDIPRRRGSAGLFDGVLHTVGVQDRQPAGGKVRVFAQGFFDARAGRAHQDERLDMGQDLRRQRLVG